VFIFLLEFQDVIFIGVVMESILALKFLLEFLDEIFLAVPIESLLGDAEEWSTTLQ
jgi:hypothetical protein